MLVNRTMGGGLPAPSFWLELRDAGAGVVNTTPSLANGSPTATFTRATTAWTKLSTGLWASVASGSARSCYLGADTTVGAYGGYFAEAAGIQLVTPTASIRDMSDASWAKVTITAVKTSTGIDGVGSSCSRVTATAGNGTILQTLVAAASNRTYSCFIKRITGTGEIDISEDGTTWTNITSQINSATFTRVSITVSQLNAAFGLRIVTSGDAIDVDFNQFEAGGFATSPMDAAGAARNADALTYTSSGNVGSVTSSLYCEWLEPSIVSDTANFPRMFQIDDGSENNVATLFANPSATSTATARMIGATVANAGASSLASSISAIAINKIAGTFAVNRSAISVNGQSVVQDTTAVVYPISPTTIRICNRSSGDRPTFGTIKNVRIWARKLADNQLVSLTQ